MRCVILVSLPFLSGNCFLSWSEDNLLPDALATVQTLQNQKCHARREWQSPLAVPGSQGAAVGDLFIGGQARQLTMSLLKKIFKTCLGSVVRALN